MIAIIYFIVLFVYGCNAVETMDTWHVSIHVTDDENVAVPEATVQIMQKSATTTKNGTAKITLRGREGDIVNAEIICPKNWQATSQKNKSLVFRKMRRAVHSPTQTLNVHFHCIPHRKNHVLIVKTNGIANLPIQLNGTSVSKTDDDGIAQVIVSGHREEQVHLRLSTTEQPELVPRNPSLLITLPQKRKIMVFEQTFETAEAPEKRKGNKRRRSHFGPQRL